MNTTEGSLVMFRNIFGSRAKERVLGRSPNGTASGGTGPSAGGRVTCRDIEESDVPAVISLLCRGFPTRSETYWRRGFDFLSDRTIPATWPRYGIMIDVCGEPVGVVLQLFSWIAESDPVRCNLSSWYVEPAFASHTGSLILRALRRRDVVYTNLSAARHTVKTVQAIGFERYAGGKYYSVPALAPRVRGVEVRTVGPDDDVLGQAYGPLLSEHSALGCINLIVESPEGSFPFVFVPVSLRSGRVPLPMVQLAFCASPADFTRFAGPIGRHLLLHHRVPSVLVYSSGRISGLPGLFREPGVGIYFRNGTAPRLNDLAYSESVIFGS